MKRFAANYLYIPEKGFLRQHIIEITETGAINRIFPLTEEMASVAWLPGVLILIPSTIHNQVIENARSFLSANIGRTILERLPDNYLSEVSGRKINIIRAYPFDFIRFCPYPNTEYLLIEYTL